MNLFVREGEPTPLMIVIIMVLGMLAGIALGSFIGCSDTVEQPTIKQPTVESIPDSHQQGDKVDEDIEASIREGNRIQGLVRPKPIGDNEVVVAKKLVIDVDSFVKHIIDNNLEAIEDIIGKPVLIVENDHNNKKGSWRFYRIANGNNIDIGVFNNIIGPLNITYRQGYETSIKAIEAAGIKAEQLTLKKQVPEADFYTADTDNHHYKQIFVTNIIHDPKNLWDHVVFTF